MLKWEYVPAAARASGPAEPKPQASKKRPHFDRHTGVSRTLPVKTVNIKTGYPTAEQAMLRLSQELRIAKANRLRTLKIIHGYGSTGVGGARRRLHCAGAQKGHRLRQAE